MQWRYSDFPADFPRESPLLSCHRWRVPGCRPQSGCASWSRAGLPDSPSPSTDAAGADRTVILVLRQGRTGLVLTALGGLVFLAAAAFFFAPRSGQTGVDSFFWISFLYGLAIMIGGVFSPRRDPVLTTSFDLLQFVCLAGLAGGVSPARPGLPPAVRGAGPSTVAAAGAGRRGRRRDRLAGRRLPAVLRGADAGQRNGPGAGP